MGRGMPQPSTNLYQKIRFLTSKEESERSPKPRLVSNYLHYVFLRLGNMIWRLPILIKRTSLIPSTAGSDDMRSGPPRVHSRFPLCRLTLPSAGLAGLQTSVIEGVSQSGHTKKRAFWKFTLKDSLKFLLFVCWLHLNQNVAETYAYIKFMSSECLWGHDMDVFLEPCPIISSARNLSTYIFWKIYGLVGIKK